MPASKLIRKGTGEIFDQQSIGQRTVVQVGGEWTEASVTAVNLDYLFIELDCDNGWRIVHLPLERYRYED